MQADGNGVLAQRNIQDGGPGDADGVANGIIVDLFGPQSTLSEQDANPGLSLSDGDAAASESGGGGGCFINSLF